MKRKHPKKLTLNRETLHRLEPSFLNRIGGALPRAETGYTDCHTKCASGCCPNDGGTVSFGTCKSCGVCSGGCETGGACTDSLVEACSLVPCNP